jgi:hypothetical protein
LKSIAVTPATATIVVGQTQQFTATGTFSDGSTQNITTSAAWTSSDATTATVGAATGIAAGVKAGAPVTITASKSGVSGTASLTVSASGPAVTPSVTLLNFGTVLIGNSATLMVTLTNNSATTIPVAISVTGTNGSDFVPSPISCSLTPTGTPGATCSISVKFTPSPGPAAAPQDGSEAASLQISYDDTGSPQSVALSGTGTSAQFILTTAPGSSPSATTNPGGTVAYGLSLTGIGGFTGTVQLGCTSASQLITCSVVPASVTLTKSTTEVAIVIDTFCQGSSAPPARDPRGITGGPGALLMLAALACVTAWSQKKRRSLALSFALLALMSVGLSACNNLPKGPNGATQPGQYSLTVSATANGQTQQLPLTLIVN